MTKNNASFRDPAGFVFTKDNTIYRQINSEYFADYDTTMQSGFYARATSKHMLIKHELISRNDEIAIIGPKKIDWNDPKSVDTSLSLN